MNNSCVVILDPRGIILSGGADVIERHKSYAKQLAKLTSKNKVSLVILSASKININTYQLGNFQIESIAKPTFNALSFARKALKIINTKNYDVRLLVIGDPWESFWSAQLLNKSFLKKIPIQVQLHGDIASPAWRKISFRNKFRYYLAKLSLPKATGIRAVSRHQARLVAKTFKVKKSSISIIPVPITNLKLMSSPLNRRPKTIALIGRIHFDRGLSNFEQLVKTLAISRQDFKILIAGDGPDRIKFLASLSKIIPKSKIKYMGQLSEVELKNIWNQVGVLVSTAPAESYGRVMREALVAGVPVWATKSSGVEDLISKAGKDAVKILDLSKNSNELSKELDQLLKCEVLISFRKQFIKDNSTSAQLLAKSWIDLINKQT